MGDILNSTTSVCCDLFFYVDFEGIECQEDACIAYNACVTALSCVIALFMLCVLIAGLRRESATSLRQIVLYFLFVAVIHKSAAWYYVSGFLYLLPLFIAYVAWTLLIFVWIRVYKMMTREGELTKLSVFQRGWFAGYVLFVSVCGTVWIFFIAFNFVTDVGALLLNLWSAISLFSLSVGLLVFAWRVNKKMEEQAAVRANNSQQDEFTRMRWFIILNSIVFLVMVVVFVLAGVLELILPNSMAWFLIRHSIYRAFEFLTLVTVSSTFSPHWRILFRTIFSSNCKGASTDTSEISQVSTTRTRAGTNAS